MEAIIKHSGRQFKVTKGMTIEVDYRDVQPGSEIEFGEVLCVTAEGSEPKIGAPSIEGAKVIGKVVGTVKGPKLIAASFRRRKNSRRRMGHRQSYTQVQIESIEA